MTLDELGERLIRIEVKLDQSIADSNDHEGRLRTIERAGYVTGRQLWTVTVSCAAVIGGVATGAGLFLR
jgi:hypothetical protein